jgi:hypothetical protein
MILLTSHDFVIVIVLSLEPKQQPRLEPKTTLS